MKVSVIIPVHNQKRFLAQAVESVLSQKIHQMEVLVVDDGSTDGSAESVADFDVKILRQAQAGPAAAMNRGVREAQGDFVTFLDSDDVMVPGSLYRRMEWLQMNPQYPAIGGYVKSVIDAEGCAVSMNEFHIRQMPDLLSMDFYRTGSHYPAYPWLYFFKREIFDRIKGFDETLRMAHDLEFLYRLLNEVGVVPLRRIPVAHRRIHAHALSFKPLPHGEFELKDSKLAEQTSIRSRFDIPREVRRNWELPTKSHR